MSSRPLGVIVEFLAAFARVMRWRVGLACALIVLSGATEGLGLLLLFPLLAALGVHGGDSTPDRVRSLMPVLEPRPPPGRRQCAAEERGRRSPRGTAQRLR